MPFLFAGGTKTRRKTPRAYRAGTLRLPHFTIWDRDDFDLLPLTVSPPREPSETMKGRKSQKQAAAATASNHDIGQMLSSTPRTQEPLQRQPETAPSA
ncbi:Hypothetical predicted protein, partial [Pelobates cultripes]